MSKKNPDRFVRRAAKIIRTGFGQPSIFNSDLIVQELVRMGKSVIDARCGGSSGCVEVGAFGKEAYILTGYFNLPKVLELTLNNGLDPRAGRMLGIPTGDPRTFTSFDDLFAAFERQMLYFIDIKVRGNNTIERLYAKYMPAPFLSLLTADCIERGREYHAGGVRYNTSYIQGGPPTHNGPSGRMSEWSSNTNPKPSVRAYIKAVTAAATISGQAERLRAGRAHLYHLGGIPELSTPRAPGSIRMITRQRWATRTGLILALAGNAIGLGNFLRFPVQAAQNGGGAFMVPYFVALVLIGLPMMWVECAIGRLGGKHGHGHTAGMMTQLWHQPAAKYVGALGIFIPFTVALYYTYITLIVRLSVNIPKRFQILGNWQRFSLMRHRQHALGITRMVLV